MPALHSPKVPDMISIARGNDVITTHAQVKSFRMERSAVCPVPAIEYASAALTEMRSRNSPPTAALEAVAAAPQPPCPASSKVVRIDAANHIRLRTARPEITAAIRIRVR